MSDIPRRKIDSSPTVIEWIRMVARSTGISSASAAGFYNMGIVNGVLQWVDSVGAILRAAPAEATYIVQTADSALQNEQAIGALSTGMLKGATTTGVISSVPWFHYYSAIGVLTTYADYGTTQLGTAGSATRLQGTIPSHVTTISSARIRFFIGAAVGNEQYDLSLQGAAVGEVYNAVTAAASNQPITWTGNDRLYEVNATALFSGITGGDQFGIRITNDQINSGQFFMLGIYLEGA